MKRVVSLGRLSPDDFSALAARRKLGARRYRKIGRIAARPATPGERIETRWNGVETENTAAAGDWVATALDDDGAPLRDATGAENVYVVPAARFDGLYEPTGGTVSAGAVHRPIGLVRALHLPAGFDILAPWGARQRAEEGYLLLNGDEVYGNHGETFRATYRPRGLWRR